MPRLILFLMLWPLASPAFSTFELTDPAAEIFAEKQNRQQASEEPEFHMPAEETFCALDLETDTCWCVHRETATVVSIEQEECVIRAAGKPGTSKD